MYVYIYMIQLSNGKIELWKKDINFYKNVL